MIDVISNIGGLFSIALGIIVCYFALLNYGRKKDKVRVASAVALGVAFASYGAPIFLPVAAIEASAISAILVCVVWSIYTYRLLGNKSSHVLLSIVPVIGIWALLGIKGLVFCALVASGFVIGYNRMYRRLSSELIFPITLVNAGLILWMFELFGDAAGLMIDGTMFWALISLAHRLLMLAGGAMLARFLGTNKMDDVAAKAVLNRAFRI